MENRYSVSELLEMSLEGLPATARGIQQKAKREEWTFTEVPAKGGRGGVKKIYELPPALLTQIRTAARTIRAGKQRFRQPENRRCGRFSQQHRSAAQPNGRAAGRVAQD